MPSHEASLNANKATVLRFNTEVIERGDAAAFQELMAPTFINRTAPAEAPNGPESMWHTISRVLRPAFPDLQVQIHTQIAEGDLVTTRKTIHATHLGELLGIPPTNERVSIDVIDIVRIVDGKYAEHWGLNTLPAVLASLRDTR